MQQRLPDAPSVFLPILNKAKKLTGANSEKQDAVSSIFSFLNINGKTGQKKYYPNQSMVLSEAYFPKKEKEGLNKQFWEGFEKDIADIPNKSDEKIYAETLLHIMHKYATVIPSPVGEEISLYDFSKMKAALAVCLSILENEYGVGVLPDKPFLLVGGTVKGIQDFIYDIVSKNASKNLKGRSYYLQLLVDTILHKILNELGLFQANVVYGSGGGYFLIAPNTEEVRGKLATLEKEIEEALFKEHKIALSLLLSWVEFKEETLTENRLDEVWRKLDDELNTKRRNVFSSQIIEAEGIFDVSEIGGAAPRDAVTNEELLEEELFIIDGAVPRIADNKEIGDGENLIGQKTREQIMLGFYMKSEMFRLTGNQDLNILPDDFL